MVSFAGRRLEVPRGKSLRKVLMEAGLTPHNGHAGWLDCRGSGTCGTCAVAVEGAVSGPTRRERWRLCFPPHERVSGLRFTCRCRVEGDVTVHKSAGFWGQKVGEEGGSDQGPR